MKTIRYTKMDSDKIIELLNRGGLLAMPTDTVFGLACMMDEQAIARVYEAKGRSFDKPLPMMCSSKKMISEVAKISEEAEKIIDRFMPGALTIVFAKQETVADYITNGRKTIGIRMPDDDFILSLIEKLGKPLMVTSANISGNGSLTRWEDVLSAMDGKIEGIICEDARGDKASTIIDVSGDLRLLREGPLSFNEIEECIK
ncbi:MAG: threonylcarbamoyl-AMP synthase [Erysipelotrichaceae bacterium]|nr:threonylcarbamoyl-AMP synthase [Erysipelotrichaceae bacterium]